MQFKNFNIEKNLITIHLLIFFHYKIKAAPKPNTIRFAPKKIINKIKNCTLFLSKTVLSNKHDKIARKKLETKSSDSFLKSKKIFQTGLQAAITKSNRRSYFKALFTW